MRDANSQTVQVPWKYMVIDEGHRMKNHSGKLVQVGVAPSLFQSLSLSPSCTFYLSLRTHSRPSSLLRPPDTCAELQRAAAAAADRHAAAEQPARTVVAAQLSLAACLQVR
jgi:hypothetical protein